MLSFKTSFFVEIPYTEHNLGIFFAEFHDEAGFLRRSGTDFSFMPAPNDPFTQDRIVIRIEDVSDFRGLEAFLTNLKSSLEDLEKENSRTSKMSTNLRSR